MGGATKWEGGAGKLYPYKIGGGWKSFSHAEMGMCGVGGGGGGVTKSIEVVVMHDTQV